MPIPLRGRDDAEDAIVDLLRLLGAQVFRVDPPINDPPSAGVPDLLVFYRGRLAFAEVKTGNRNLSLAQQSFPIADQVFVLRDITDAEAMLTREHGWFVSKPQHERGLANATDGNSDRA